jgi:hypothetical protein
MTCAIIAKQYSQFRLHIDLIWRAGWIGPHILGVHL